MVGVNIGARLRKIREFRNYTQTHMAHKLNISQNAYSKIESGSTPITTERLEQIAELLDVPADAILANEPQIFNLENNTIEKFYGYIENLQEENKEAWLKTIAILEQQVEFLKEQNASLLKIIDKKNP